MQERSVVVAVGVDDCGLAGGHDLVGGDGRGRRLHVDLKGWRGRGVMVDLDLVVHRGRGRRLLRRRLAAGARCGRSRGHAGAGGRGGREGGGGDRAEQVGILGRFGQRGVGWRTVDAEGHVLDHRKRQPALVAHQADGGLVNNLVENHKVLVLEAVFRALEVVVQVVLKLGPLLIDVGEVDEEPGAHVPLRRLHLVRGCRAIALAEKVAVL